MDPEKPEAPLDLGIYGRQVRAKVELVDIVAAALSLIWVATVAGFWFFIGISSGEGDPGFNPMTFVMTMVSILLPVGLIWVASASAKTAKVMREEASRLQASIDAMRHAYVSQQQRSGQVVRPAVQSARPSRAKASDPAGVATFHSRREPIIAAPEVEKPLELTTPEVTDEPHQPSFPGVESHDPTPKETAHQPDVLSLNNPVEPEEILAEMDFEDLPVEPENSMSIPEFIRALNFPENEDDKEGFRTLRRALEDPDIARMIRASQDILTLMSQDGIYMDDLRPDRPRAETWRRYARGDRGPAVAGLGGIRDRTCLALTAGRVQQDPVFRDAAQHFLRQFDTVLAEFEKTATDEELAAMGETRSARAFMLLGRVAGTFD